MEKADIGVIGLAVMGRNLVLNLVDNGFRVSVYNRTTRQERLLQEFLEKEAKQLVDAKKVIGSFDLSSFVTNIKQPRRILLMISAGQPIDYVVDELTPLLDKGDIIMDGGNSEQSDTTRRYRALRNVGLHFMGIGVSGGEEGARHGPSIMPGGSLEGWLHTKDILQAISAKADGKPCCSWIGLDISGNPTSSEGAGHFVKTVHNGIGYADMQLLAEAYHLMRDVLNMDLTEIAEAFDNWNAGNLEWRLLENTAEILRFKDKFGDHLVEKIRDAAAQKGTGKWAVIEAMNAGVPATVINESVSARFVSALKDDRVAASTKLVGPSHQKFDGNLASMVDDIRKAVQASKIILYAQGFMLLQESLPRLFGCYLNCADLAQMWRGGCVIRSTFLDHVKNAFILNPQLKNLLMDEYFIKTLADFQMSWRRVIVTAINHGIPAPAFSAALSYYDSFRCPRLPANLLQAQRDFYGAHTFELLEQPGVFHHNDWNQGKSQ
ncbi:6-phosphogluconate dehydrogenase, decarboxylating-like isoform X1 [Daphnia pulex]|uniref:6-phosphogluconate dehydrogenase, decarboxylating-like isoform X1 n=2 Tax=Daphnia pulex TaxID=6669 RepID=UPI001EE113F6|nr:6-phosphogluconate dehydrogenase, decarboxylating-like isoform X1 [Daphnia pulex]